jgi:hypothetical protein
VSLNVAPELTTNGRGVYLTSINNAVLFQKEVPPGTAIVAAVVEGLAEIGYALFGRPDFEVASENFGTCVACTTLSPTACAIRLNKLRPSGTSGGWQHNGKDGVACKDHPNRRHYVFVC